MSEVTVRKLAVDICLKHKCSHYVRGDDGFGGEYEPDDRALNAVMEAMGTITQSEQGINLTALQTSHRELSERLLERDAEVKRLGDELTYLRSVDWPAQGDVQEAVLSRLGINERLRAMGDEMERYKEIIRSELSCTFHEKHTPEREFKYSDGIFIHTCYFCKNSHALLNPPPQDEATRIAERQGFAEGLDEAQR